MTAADLRQFSLLGDPEADRVILYGNTPAGREYLTKEIDYFRFQALRWPSWAHAQRVLRGQHLFLRNGPLSSLVLHIGILPELALLLPSFRVWLRSTESNQGSRQNQWMRFAANIGEVERLVFQEDALWPGNPGAERLGTLRLDLAQIRAASESQPRGLAFNQLEMSFAASLLVYGYSRGMRAMGISLTAEEMEDWCHFIRVVAALAGQSEILSTENFEQAADLYYSLADIFLEQNPPVSANLGFLPRMLPPHWRVLPENLIRSLQIRLWHPRLVKLMPETQGRNFLTTDENQIWRWVIDPVKPWLAGYHALVGRFPRLGGIIAAWNRFWI